MGSNFDRDLLEKGQIECLQNDHRVPHSVSQPHGRMRLSVCVVFGH